MALRKRRVGSIDGLTNLLAGKLNTAAIMAAKVDVENSNSVATVASTAAVNEIVLDINTQITNLNNSIGGLIDDAADTGNSVTWSVDKLKAYVASVDDSIVVSDITERDNLSEVYDTLIAYVIDTTGDSSLGDNEGSAAAYIYVDGTGWSLLQILGQDIDVTPFVKYTDVVDDLTTGGDSVPLSAAQGVALKALVDAAAQSTEIVVDSGLVISGDDFTSTYTPVGDVIGGTAEVETSSGVWDIVDIVAGTGAKAWTLLPGTANEYDGKTCRITYLKSSAEA
jgi:hypothetical protein